MSNKIKILIFSANPVHKGRLRLDEEVRALTTEIEPRADRGVFEVGLQHALRPSDLQRALLRYKPEIVHFSGHGRPTGEILLEDSSGKSEVVSGQVLADLFRGVRNDVRLVFFDLCYSSAQANAVKGVVDYTVGTGEATGDEAAMTFAASFYRGLALRDSVKEAFELAKVKLELDLPGSVTPSLFIRSGVDPAESFTKQSETTRRDYVEKLRQALVNMFEGTSSDEQNAFVRGGLLDGRLTIEQTENSDSETQIPETFSLYDNGEFVEVQVSVARYALIQRCLYPQMPGLAPPLPGLVFVGRENALADVKSLLLREKDLPSKNPIVVRGWPGVGKTTLVSVLGRDPILLSAFPDGVLWTSLEEQPSLMTKLAEWGRALGTDDLLHTPTVREATFRLGSLLRNRQMLLILDGVWEDRHARPFLDASADSNCTLLITTRLTAVAEGLTQDDRVYVLPVLSEDDSLAFLRILAPAVVDQYPDECLQLIRDIFYLPLAIEVAGRLLRKEAMRGVGVADLIKEIRMGSELIPEPAPLDRAEGAVLPTVTALLRRTTDRLDAHTRECFAYLGAFAPKPATFSLDAMSAIWNVEDPKPIVRELVGHGLLEPVGNGRFQLHALLVQHAHVLLAE